MGVPTNVCARAFAPCCGGNTTRTVNIDREARRRRRPLTWRGVSHSRMDSIVRGSAEVDAREGRASRIRATPKSPRTHPDSPPRPPEPAAAAAPPAEPSSVRRRMLSVLMSRWRICARGGEGNNMTQHIRFGQRSGLLKADADDAMKGFINGALSRRNVFARCCCGGTQERAPDW